VKQLHLIGDPHMGRDFKGVPLHRKGERELSQLVQLREHLLTPCAINVNMGDVFDKPLVDLKVVHAVVDLYYEASEALPDTLFVVQAGNHDLFRQLVDKEGRPLKGSFHALARMIDHLPNVRVLFEPCIIGDIGFFPWQWDCSAKDQVNVLGGSYSVGIGHWDLSDFGGSNEHLCPAALLEAHGATDIFSGHYHVAGEYVVDGRRVQCTGSMQPYTHGEDPTGKFYRTLTLAELESMDDDEVRSMNLRVVLEPGETLPDIDCLSIISMRQDAPEALAFEDSVGLEDFELSLVLAQRFEELGVPESVQTFIREKIGAID
jgi:hypothetical protein